MAICWPRYVSPASTQAVNASNTPSVTEPSKEPAALLTQSMGLRENPTKAIVIPAYRKKFAMPVAPPMMPSAMHAPITFDCSAGDTPLP